MTHEEFSNLEAWRFLPTRSFNTLFMETISELLLRVEKLENENKEIKEILIMFINRIKRSGELYPFSFEEKERLFEIANKWLNLEQKPCPCGDYDNCEYLDDDCDCCTFLYE